MATATLNFTVVGNNTVPVALTVQTSSGALWDMSGYSGKWQAKDVDLPSIPLITKQTNDGSATISSSVFAFTINSSETQPMQSGNFKTYVHELVITDTGGNSITITNNDSAASWGTMTVRREWTGQ